MGDNVEIDILTNDLHASQQIGGNWAYDDAVVVFVKSLDFSQVGFDALVFVDAEVGEENGFLDAVASHPLQILNDVVSHFIALYVIHDEKQHVACGFDCGLPLPAAEGGSDVVDQIAVETKHLVAVVLNPADVFLHQLGVVGAICLQQKHKRLLVFHLLHDDILDPNESIVGEREIELSLADGGYRTIARTPNPPDGLSAAVHEHDLNFAVDGQHHRIAGDLSSTADLDGFEAVGRDTLSTIFRRDDEPLVLAAEGNTECIEYQFHGEML